MDLLYHSFYQSHWYCAASEILDVNGSQGNAGTDSSMYSLLLCWLSDEGRICRQNNYLYCRANQCSERNKAAKPPEANTFGELLPRPCLTASAESKPTQSNSIQLKSIQVQVSYYVAPLMSPPASSGSSPATTRTSRRLQSGQRWVS